MGFSMMGAMGDYMAKKNREIVKIRLDKIREDEKNDFEVTGGVEIEKKNALLKDSIEQFGLLDPLVVRPSGDGDYILVSGHRRKLMHDRLVEEGKTQFEQAECIVINVNDVDAEQILLEANIPNRVISDWEKMQAVKRMNDIFQRREDSGEKIEGRRREHIAGALGMSVSAVGRLEKIEKSLGEEYKQELKEGNIGISVADKLASKPVEEQKAIHEAMGPKVKLVDFAKFEKTEEQPEDEPKEEPEPEQPKETRTKLLGIAPELGELTVIVINIRDNRYRAGYCGWAMSEDGAVHSFDFVNEQYYFSSYDKAWDGAINLIKMDPLAKPLLMAKEKQGAAGEIIQQPEETIEEPEVEGDRSEEEIQEELEACHELMDRLRNFETEIMQQKANAITKKQRYREKIAQKVLLQLHFLMGEGKEEIEKLYSLGD